MRTYVAPRMALLLLALALVMPSATARADSYVFDRAHTNIAFSWDHMGLNRLGGRVTDFAGTLEFNAADPEAGSVEVTMKAASLWTGFEALDKHLRTADFFDAARFPTMTFKSTAARKTGDKTGEVAGDLTMLGQSRPVTLQVTWNFTGEHPLGNLNPIYIGKVVSGFTATAKLKRSDWGLSRAIPLISDEIEITINAQLIKR